MTPAVRSRTNGRYYTVIGACRVATNRCHKTCKSPKANCTRLLPLVLAGRMDVLPVDPADFFIHWDGAIDIEYQEAMEGSRVE